MSASLKLRAPEVAIMSVTEATVAAFAGDPVAPPELAHMSEGEFALLCASNSHWLAKNVDKKGKFIHPSNAPSF